jgi:hypothetical protein
VWSSEPIFQIIIVLLFFVFFLSFLIRLKINLKTKTPIQVRPPVTFEGSLEKKEKRRNSHKFKSKQPTLLTSGRRDKPSFCSHLVLLDREAHASCCDCTAQHSSSRAQIIARSEKVSGNDCGAKVRVVPAARSGYWWVQTGNIQNTCVYSDLLINLAIGREEGQPAF